MCKLGFCFTTTDQYRKCNCCLIMYMNLNLISNTEQCTNKEMFKKYSSHILEAVNKYSISKEEMQLIQPIRSQFIKTIIK